MLIKRAVLDRIAAGEIDLVYRKWTRPTVKSGGTLRTAIGVLDIESVDRVSVRSIRSDDARRAGYTSRKALVDDLSSRPTGELYRIAVRYAGDDPRIALRETTQPTAEQLDDIRRRLERIDRSSTRGPWTADTLRLLRDNPEVRAQYLADRLGLEKARFKVDVRKLKALGLTISHSPGYTLSPLGVAVLSSLEDCRP